MEQRDGKRALRCDDSTSKYLSQRSTDRLAQRHLERLRQDVDARDRLSLLHQRRRQLHPYEESKQSTLIILTDERRADDDDVAPLHRLGDA